MGRFGVLGFSMSMLRPPLTNSPYQPAGDKDKERSPCGGGAYLQVEHNHQSEFSHMVALTARDAENGVQPRTRKKRGSAISALHPQYKILG